MCSAEVASGQAEEVEAGEIPPATWFAILLRDFDRERSTVSAPVIDCAGRSLQPEIDPQARRCLGERDEGLPRNLRASDLHVQSTPDGRSLVWIRATDHRDGTSSGPVALAEWTERGIAIRAIGGLRTAPQEISLRLETTGVGDLLLAESRMCEPGSPGECTRLVKLLQREGDRFAERPVRAEDGACLGPPTFAMEQTKRVQLPNGKARNFSLRRTLELTSSGVLLSESVVVEDADPAQPDAPASVFRKASLERHLEVRGGGWVTKPSLWDAMLAEHGSVRIDAAATPAVQSTP